jgi:hypothetical protein
MRIWQWQSTFGNSSWLTETDRPKQHYETLKKHLALLDRQGRQIWLLTSRPATEQLTNLWKWDKLIIDIEDPWLDLNWGSSVNQPYLLNLLNKADSVFANGPSLADEYSKLSRRFIYNLPNGVEDTFSESLQKAPIKSDYFNNNRARLRVTFTGNINDRIDFQAVLQVTECNSCDFYFFGNANIPAASEIYWRRLLSCSNFFWIPAVGHNRSPRNS